VEVDDKLKLDYEQTCQQIRAFTDIRFKLLAFVPTLTAAAVALLGNVTDQWRVLAVGLLGLFVTLGLAFYEMRNTVLYRAAIDRAKRLEVSLGLLTSPRDEPDQEYKEYKAVHYGGFTSEERGGLFSQRPDPPRLFKKLLLLRWVKKKLHAGPKRPTQPSEEKPGLEVWHGQALAFVYSAALGGWAYIVANSLLNSLLSLFSQQRSKVDAVNSLTSILAALIVALLFAQVWYRFDEPTSLEPTSLEPTSKQPTSKEPTSEKPTSEKTS